MKRKNPITVRLWVALALAFFTTRPAFAQSITLRWNSPSRLTPEQASDVFYRQADGGSVAPSDLFEAEKYLRTDGAVSLGATVMKAMLKKLATDHLAAAGETSVRIRVLDPVLHWADSSSFLDERGAPVVRVRGETLDLVVLNLDPNLAATQLFHMTLYQDWKLCGPSPCFSPVSGAVRSNVSYELAVPLQSTAPGEARASELLLASGFTGGVFAQTYSTTDPSRWIGVACDPLPSQTAFTPDSVTPSMMFFTHAATRTENREDNRLLCGFFALSGGELARVTYRVGGALSEPPSTAARSAVVKNPLEFPLFE